MSPINNKLIYTVGHSTRSLEELINILTHHGIEVLVDVRHYPNSRRHPQFNKGILESNLQEVGVEYIWIEDLGGFREEGYEEYTKTAQFRNAINELTSTAENKASAVMCAELEWSNCHRKHIASYLKHRGWEVTHIYDQNKTEPHQGDQYRLF